MNKLQMAQYIAEEFMNETKLVTKVREGEGPITAIIVFEDGQERQVSGKLAADLMNAVDKIIYIDTEIGVSGAEPGVNGEVINPVNNYEDAKKLAEYYEKHGIRVGMEKS